MPKITIIIPIYNVGKYLYQCLNSVINQTLKDIEIICVNDSSTDDSLSILEKFVLKDSRIKIISLKKNSGTGYARNIGIDKSTGEYIMFIDPDDYIELNACEILYNNAERFQSDYVEFLFDRFHTDMNDFYTLPREYNLPDIGIIDKNLIFANNIFAPPIMAWNKFYKSSFLKNNKIYFSIAKHAEDHIVTIKSRCLAKRITTVNSILYHYRHNEHGISYFDKRKILKILSEIKQFLNKNGLLERVYRDWYNYSSKLLQEKNKGYQIDHLFRDVFYIFGAKRYDNIISLGYNCQVQFALNKIYGEKNLVSSLFAWVYCPDVNKLINYLHSPETILSKGLTFDIKDFMYTDVAMGFRYHTKKEKKDFYNVDGTLNNEFVDEDKKEVSSRIKYLSEKLLNIILSKSKNLFILCIRSEAKPEDIPNILEQISKYFSKNSGNKNSKVMCVFLQEYFGQIKLKKYNNIIFKTIEEFPPDSYADCVNIQEWKRITKQIYLVNKFFNPEMVFSIKNEYFECKKHKVLTILGIRMKFKIEDCKGVNEKF